MSGKQGHGVQPLSSELEMLQDGKPIQKDPTTAHASADDPEGNLFIPETCLACQAQAIAEAQALEAQDHWRPVQ